MSWNYARHAVLEALKKSKGSAARAQTVLMADALKDNRLLVELAQPHLKGIVAHAISKVIHEQTNPPENHPDEPEAINLPLDTFGRELLGALKGRNTPKFGQEDAAPPTSHKPASKAHIDAINKIAAKAKPRKK
jgi:hypothetical protein